MGRFFNLDSPLMTFFVKDGGFNDSESFNCALRLTDYYGGGMR